jgi:hypothetical protein
MCAVIIGENRQFSRALSKKPAGLVVKLDYEREQRFPCLITNASPFGFKLRVGVQLRCGQFVEVISNDDPFSAVRCKVIWVGKAGSKEQGEVGLKIAGVLESNQR